MIDIKSERLYSLSQAAKLDCLPIRRGGKGVHVATLWRWAMHGVRGVRLETVRAGGSLCTSIEAIERFFETLTRQSAGEPIPEPLPRARAADVRRAERVLDAAGI